MPGNNNEKKTIDLEAYFPVSEPQQAAESPAVTPTLLDRYFNPTGGAIQARPIPTTEQLSSVEAGKKLLDFLYRAGGAAGMYALSNALPGAGPAALLTRQALIRGGIPAAMWFLNPPAKDEAATTAAAMLATSYAPYLKYKFSPKNFARLTNALQRTMFTAAATWTGHRLDQLIKGQTPVLWADEDGELIFAYAITPEMAVLAMQNLSDVARYTGKHAASIAPKVAKQIEKLWGVKMPKRLPMTLSQAKAREAGPGLGSFGKFLEDVFLLGSKARQKLGWTQAGWAKKALSGVAQGLGKIGPDEVVRQARAILQAFQGKIDDAVVKLYDLLNPQAKEEVLGLGRTAAKIGRQVAREEGLGPLQQKEAIELGKEVLQSLYKQVKGAGVARLIAAATPSFSNQQAFNRYLINLKYLADAVDDPELKAALGSGLIHAVVAKSARLMREGYVISGKTFKQSLDNLGRNVLKALFGESKTKALYDLADLMNRLRPEELLAAGQSQGSRSMAYLATRGIFLVGALGVSAVTGTLQAATLVVPATLIIQKVLTHGDSFVRLMEKAATNPAANKRFIQLLTAGVRAHFAAPEDKPREPSRVP